MLLIIRVILQSCYPQTFLFRVGAFHSFLPFFLFLFGSVSRLERDREFQLSCQPIESGGAEVLFHSSDCMFNQLHHSVVGDQVHEELENDIAEVLQPCRGCEFI